ncbi:DUF2637 domain-containing protein [Streptomyces sp. KR80]|uniref:DUF2637 domain-containing protein n=1 Tax=Streptomyces sp. KR80 TaxID=3457426 RepID=UPI003FD2E223
MAATRTTKLTRTHRILVGVVVIGAIVIAAIGFAGSYAAVRDLAREKGFGAFSVVFPIGIDAGIVVLLALDLLLTWIRIPFPLLRQTAWLLTAATIAFNGAAAWPDPLGVGMHAVIPVLFVVSVEAARHAIGRIADITADRHMESVRVARWLLAFPSTFRLWRKMKLWELRSYEEVIKLEQERLVYRARLRARYGRAWRRKAPVESLMPLRLARYGVPLTETGPAGLAAAGIEPAVLPAAAAGQPANASPSPSPSPELAGRTGEPRSLPAGAYGAPDGAAQLNGGQAAVQPQPGPQQEPQLEPQPQPAATYAAEAAAPHVTVPVGPGRYRTLGQAQPNGHSAFVPSPRATHSTPEQQLFIEPAPTAEEYPAPEPDADDDPVGIPDGMPREDMYFAAYRQFAGEQGTFPTARQLSRALNDRFGVTNSDGSLLSESYLRSYMREFRDRYKAEMGMAG